MLSYSQAFYELLNKLKSLYDEQESGAIAHEALQHITGLDKLQRIIEKDKSFTVGQQQLFENIKADLLIGKPLQYVMGKAWFMGRSYKVNEHVLIPRPETEELVQWIIDDNKDQNLSILDIGTGSGCIPISLKLALSYTNITACDVSSDAISVAKENADDLNTSLSFLQLDFLDNEKWEKLGIHDIIVSNPPYIPANEKDQIHTNVKDFEPHIALFVPNDDPLLFYRAIAAFGKEHLKKDGSIYCELHTDHALQTEQLFKELGYNHVTVKKDIHGNYRMLKAQMVL
ncbi:MAG TPA: peptide chain release factor N(5)-glutamine methyltransferase [Flavipsychrobacter sp.]|nr:peptide chain release factor N(5)-glutamine methyltransferase [Flavipsychrobacter sp.]